MNLMIDVVPKGTLKEEDILVYRKIKNQFNKEVFVWTNINKNQYLAEQQKEIRDLYEQIKELKLEIASLKDNINNKLEEHHNAIQAIAEEE